MQRIVGAILLAIGAAYAVVILARAWRDREAVRAERGNPVLLCALEVPIFFAATLGISDFLLHTLLLRRLKVTEDERLPGTLIASGLVPGAVIAFVLLRADNPLELRTLLLCCGAMICGCLLGARLVAGLDGKKIRKLMAFALMASMAALIVKMIVSAGTSGSATGLTGAQLALAVPFAFAMGVASMLGVPTKPAGTALFLLLGLSPLTTLTLVLVMCCIGPMVGGIAVLRAGRFHRKTVCAAVVFGTLGAVIGCLVAISLNALLLNILLLVVMLIAIISFLKK